jgi:hypothetical protein
MEPYQLTDDLIINLARVEDVQWLEVGGVRKLQIGFTGYDSKGEPVGAFSIPDGPDARKLWDHLVNRARADFINNEARNV